MRPVGDIVFASVYPMYVTKVERKGRSKAELDQVLCWLTGLTPTGLKKEAAGSATFAQLHAKCAKTLNPGRALITGVVCGVRVEELKDPVTQFVRQMDKLVDELAKGKAVEKVLRKPA